VERLDVAQNALSAAIHARVHVAIPSGNELRAQWPQRDNVWKRTILSSVIERIEISRHPAAVATNLTARATETDNQPHSRLANHRADVMEVRVSVQWWH